MKFFNLPLLLSGYLPYVCCFAEQHLLLFCFRGFFFLISIELSVKLIPGDTCFLVCSTDLKDYLEHCMIDGDKYM